MIAHPLRYFNPMACFNPWQSETLTRKHWSKSRKQLIRSRSKAKRYRKPKSLSASYRKPKSGLGRGCRRRRQSPSHARLVPARQEVESNAIMLRASCRGILRRRNGMLTPFRFLSCVGHPFPARSRRRVLHLRGCRVARR